MTDQAGWRTRAGTSFTLEKQMVAGARGVVTANHPLGSAAGLEMLALGGNAVDAAVATLFALNVVEPMMVGLFGAGWTNIRLADGTQIILDNYSTAPLAATPDLYTPLSDTWPDYMETVGRANKVGYLAVGVPGTLKAWAEAVTQWGCLDLETVMQPAICYAQRGFVASGYLCELIANAQADLARFPAAASIFLPQGRPLQKGDRVVQPDLAESLQTIARYGPDVLYDGALGQTIVDDIQRNGGILTMDDLRAYATIRREPLTADYREYTVHVPAPPCAGGVHLLQILQILAGYDVASLGYGTADGVHLLAECFKIAFADRAAYLGDPADVKAPLAWLLSSDYAAERRAQIDPQHATAMRPGVPPTAESSNTTHVTAADGDGNIACMTQTINDAFGSKAMAPGTGLFLNNTMALFDPHPGRPNSVGSRRRMTSSMCPTIITRDGQPFLALGTPGGVRIFPSVLQAIVNVIDHGMTLQEAVEAPRIWTQGQDLEVEGGVPPAVRQALGERGHTVAEVSTVAGGMNGIYFDPSSGMMRGAACWRADGVPMALSGGAARSGIRFQPAVR
ncbi:MAG: gamma-glutamyltransferase [Caldilineaceae bacterium]